MLVWIRMLLLLIILIFFAFYFWGGFYGVIKGKLGFLSDTATGKSIRVGSLILIANSIILYPFLDLTKRISEIEPVYQLLKYSIMLIFFIAGGITAKYFVKKMELSNSRRVKKVNSRTPLMEYGDKRCVKCGTIYATTLTFMDPKEVKVASCRVCSVNQIYSICSQCANLEQVSQGACPFCSANHQWETRGMILKL